MLLVGLTGGIASGKSLVTRVFKELGAHVIDADRIVHDLLEPGEPVWQEVVRRFGDVILRSDRSIDRRKLGTIVFQDNAQRAWLNQCIHPRVFDAYQAQVKRLCGMFTAGIVVFDAALLIETGYHTRMDRVVLVYAGPEQQLERLMQRDRFSEEDAHLRIDAQMPLKDKRAHAHYIIENTGDRDDAERRAREVFEHLKRDAERRT